MANRNSELHFSQAPQVTTERSTFDRSVDVKTSFNVGELIPFFVDEVLPGDTFQIETSKVARLQTLLTPIMDNLYLDTYYFFVPNRLVWEHWKYFCGEAQDAWVSDVEYSIPQIYFPENGFDPCTIADYMGIPIYVDQLTTGYGVNALPFRAYALICDEWFRDENLQEPLVIPKGDAAVTGVNTGNYITDCAKGGKPFVACKYHDYFTSCLPAPQKGPSVSILNYAGSTRYAPVITRNNEVDSNTRNNIAEMYRATTGYTVTGKKPLITNGSSQAGLENVDVTGNVFASVYPTNLWSDLNPALGELSVNTLRQAFQIQRLLEKDARGGTRYIEVIKSHFNVTSPDARLQRPEYLGGNRIPLNVQQVVNTSLAIKEGEGSPELISGVGDTGAYSHTADTNYDVNKSFVEHGYIIGLMCARYEHTYQQGLERMWSRSTRFDFYWPALAHLGEQAVYKSEIYFNGQRNIESGVFGYQEAWADYRYKPNYITGQMRSESNNGLDIWHFGDDYADPPTLSASWIVEDKANVDRCLAVTSENANQIFIDIYVKNKCTRPMPLYSIPGYIDHF